MKLGGLDIGTTACKLCVYETDGRWVSSFEKEYFMHTGNGIDMNLLWKSVQECLEQASVYYDLKAIGITSFGETCVLLDLDGNPLTEALLYTDSRGSDEAAELANYFSAERIYQITGVAPDGMYSLPKLLWLKRHCPDAWKNTAFITEVGDFIAYKLTGKRQVDYSLASRTMAFDVRKREWSKILLDYIGIPERMMSTPVSAGTSVGKILPGIAEALGLSKDIQIITGAHDQVAACVGAGALKSGVAVDGGGTVQCITPVFQGFPNNYSMKKNHYNVAPYLEKDWFVSYAFFFAGGSLLKWFRDKVAQRPNAGSKFYAEMNCQIPAEPTGVLVVPHFNGSGTPYMNANDKGAIIGLSLQTDLPTLYKACMEGVAYEMRINLEKLQEAGIHVSSLLATGGASRSPEWMQIKADILGIPLMRLKNEQCGAVGSIMMSGCAMNAYTSITEAAEYLVQYGETYYPDAERHNQYTKIYEKYRRIYEALI